jgi:hypothetical protein
MRDLIQVAGVIDQAGADLLVKSGVRYLGFPLRLPVHQEDLADYILAMCARRSWRFNRRGLMCILALKMSRDERVKRKCENLLAKRGKPFVSSMKLMGNKDNRQWRLDGTERKPGVPRLSPCTLWAVAHTHTRAEAW